MSRYQKGKTNLDFTEARDSEWQWHQLGLMQACTLIQTDNHASTPPLCFLQSGCPSCRPTNSVKALKASLKKTLKGCHLFVAQHTATTAYVQWTILTNSLAHTHCLSIINTVVISMWYVAEVCTLLSARCNYQYYYYYH